MSRRFKVAGSFNPRALLIIGALALLCVSDGVGPRLLPLPTPLRDAAVRWAAEVTNAVPAPSRGVTAVVRVAMAAPVRKQAGAEQQSPHVTSEAGEGLIKPPAETHQPVQSTHLPAHFSSASLTRPPGRAPPPSV